MTESPRLRASQPQVSLPKVVTMRSFSRLFIPVLVLIVGLALAAPVRYTALQAEDLDQLLKAAAEDAKPEADSKEQGKDEKPSKEETKQESNGATKDEDSNTPNGSK